ncbi:LexA family protein [Gloeobacter morelensis]|uniref:LexA family protein n=1 Tax=Gloeobacter morelensis TaxID=2907343 RepID=UPI001E575726|nr:translesion error-prone DNA polymerase V autoproteolytic subunit [Gloeobacter morelensis]
MSRGTGLAFRFFGARPSCGFPSPADEFLEDDLCLDDLIENPVATFLVRVSGASMNPTIWDRDLLVVDRSLEPEDGDVLVAALDGELLVKRLRLHPGGAELAADNPLYLPLPLKDGLEIVCWGVATHAIRPLR